MGTKLRQFREFRERMNARVLDAGTRETKRFFQLDGAVYHDGALPAKTKEMLGLAASMVLRCNDCISYHVIECRKRGVTEQEFAELFDVALIVGGSIVIPHLRHARDLLDEVLAEEAGEAE
jgi:AhpD family alkylhydroperoxidase